MSSSSSSTVVVVDEEWKRTRGVNVRLCDEVKITKRNKKRKEIYSQSITSIATRTEQAIVELSLQLPMYQLGKSSFHCKESGDNSAIEWTLIRYFKRIEQTTTNVKGQKKKRAKKHRNLTDDQLVVHSRKLSTIRRPTESNATQPDRGSHNCTTLCLKQY